MAPRDLLVQPGSALLADPDTSVLYTYANGEALIRTSAPTAGRPAEQGLRLAPELAAHLEGARAGFAAMDGATSTLAYVELAGPVAPPWPRRLQALGVAPLRFVPANTYLCWGTVAALRDAGREPFVVRVTPLVPELKRTLPVPAATAPVQIWIVAHAEEGKQDEVRTEIGALSGVTVEPSPTQDWVDGFLHLPARITPEGEAAARRHPRVLALEARTAATPEDEVANLILCGQRDAAGRPTGSYLRWLEDHGLSGQGVAIGIVDGGVDTEHVAFDGRVHDLTGGARDWHGTFVAGIAAGVYLDEKDPNGFIYGIGIAPRAELLVQSNQKSAAELCRETVRGTGPGGARGAVQNNSWGTGLARDPARMDYGAVEAAWDSLVRNADQGAREARPLTICFSTGNSGSKGLTRPKAAKNVIVTGNSENLRPEVGQEDSDNIDEVYTGTHASSWGNCGDGRVRPDLVAPGEWTASANYDSHPGEKEYLSPRLTWGGGSSAASPKTAGACALLIQWWRQHHAEPSPALLRALLVNGAEPMNFRQPIPNRYEGWGRLSLASLLDETVARVYEDQTILLGERGETREWKVRVADPRRPIKITLCWTDPPGSPGSGDRPANSAIVNSLVLRAVVNGVAYRGNNFQNGWSASAEVPGAQPEGADNLQNIFLPAGAIDATFRVLVEARNITANCREPSAVTPQQDFALVITNARLDEVTTPADVYVSVDPQAGSDEASSADDHWQPGEDGDRAELADAAPVGGDGAPAAVDLSADEQAWWDAGEDYVGSETGRERRAAARAESGRDLAVASPLADRRFAEAVASGIDLIAAAGDGRVLLGVKPPAAGGESGPAEALRPVGRDTEAAVVRRELAAHGALPLALALDRLEAGWSAMGVRAGGATGGVALRSAVLVVGRGTRVTRQDLSRMRRVGLLGRLFLVSDDAGVLAFLAQRIHKRQGVVYRLAEDAASVPALVRDTLVEASGGRRVVVEEGRSSAADGRVAQTHRFQIIPADRRLALQLTWPPEAPPTLRVRRPGKEGFEAFDPDHPGADASVRRSEGLLVVTIEAPADGSFWVGTWELDTSQEAPAGGAPSARVRVWTWGDLDLRVERRESTARSDGKRAESGREEAERLMLVGSGAVAFRSVQVETRSGLQAEDERTVAVAPRRSRLDAVDVGLGAGTVSEAENVPLLTAAIRIPTPPRRIQPGARLADLILTAVGKDPAGNDFQRVVRANTLALEPRSAWRERLGPPPSKFVELTGARVVKVEYSAQTGEPTALRLAKNGQQRTVRVTAPRLRQELLRIDLQAQKQVFQVQGDELCAVVVLLDAARPEVAAVALG